MKMGLPARRADRIYTYADYLGWHDDERWELIDGVAWNMSPAPNRFHQALSARIHRRILDLLEDSPCRAYAAPFDVLLPDRPGQNDGEVTTVVQPDISVICDRGKLTDRGCTGVPDLIVEILSPFTSKKDMHEKLELYERHRVQEYWIVDPGNRYVHIHRLDGNGKYPGDPEILLPGGTARSEVISGLAVDIAELFAPD